MDTTLTRIVLVAAALALLAGCGMIPYKEYTNTPAAQLETAPQPEAGPQGAQASFTLRDVRYVQTGAGRIDCTPKKRKDVLVMLALSGGGSRASLFSALAMYEMHGVDLGGTNLLAEVDLISSVSGGSLPAAYYAISEDPLGQDERADCHGARSGRIWDKPTITALMTRDYRDRGLMNWISPGNFLLYWFTTYNRSDIMAETLDSSLYTAEPSGRSLTFADLNPARPNLVLNATLATQDASRETAFGQPFTFTREDFDRIGSSLDDYGIARAVMASSAFPGYFNFMALRNYRAANGSKEYVHVFDGGNSDNLGLTSIKREIWMLHQNGTLAHYRKIVVVLVDAYTGRGGVSAAATDPRRWYDYAVDSNIVTATDSLLAKNRVELINQFETADLFPYGHTVWEEARDASRRQIRKRQASIACERFFSWESGEAAQTDCETTDWDALNLQVGQRLVFEHIRFQDVSDPDLREQLQSIETDFALSEDRNPRTGLTAAEAIACAVPLLIGAGPDSSCDGKYHMSPEVQQRWQALVRDLAPPPLILCGKGKATAGGQDDPGCQSVRARTQ